MLTFGGFQIDPQRAELRGPSGELIKLRPKAFDMLVFFAGNTGRLLTKPELMERFWPGLHVGEDSLFQCIREIRAALGDEQRLIVRNISGRGYLFEAEVTVLHPEPAPAVIAEPVVDLPAPREPEAALPVQQLVVQPAHVQPSIIPPALIQTPPSRRRIGWIIAASLACLLVLAAAVMAGIRPFTAAPVAALRPSVTVMPLAVAQDSAPLRAMAADVTERLSAGLARIENIRVVAPEQPTAQASLQPASGRASPGDYVVSGELQKDEQGWLLRARMTRSAGGEIVWTQDADVASVDGDAELQQSRLAAAVGHPLALRINAILNGAVPGASGAARVAVEQAQASIVQTSPERFRAAQAMLENALREQPDDVDAQAELAALQMRGIQMVWYPPEQREAVRANAQQLLERVLKVKPSYVPVLESYCRLLSATNHFVQSLVACARTLSFDPWNGLALYHIGLDQIFLGRFEEALTHFRQADQYDTPTVSRWTWLLGGGFALIYLERYEEAIPWLERSLAVTPGTGRTHLLLMIAYHQLGRDAESRAMLLKTIAMRPGVTVDNVGPPTENTSPVYLAAAAKARGIMIAAGLPQR